VARRNKVLRLSPRAETDLEAIYDYTVEHWSVRQARSYLKGLEVTLMGLAGGRRVGRDAEFDNGMMKVIHESHVVYYLTTDRDINVVRILHTSMDAPRRLH
jgi:toxin ParE1/3/4